MLLPIGNRDKKSNAERIVAVDSDCYNLGYMNLKRTLTFCIHTRNRFWQLSKTLPKNLGDNHRDRQQVNFVLVDFESSDQTVTWVTQSFPEYLASGFLSLFRAPALEPYQRSLAKNTSLSQGTGDILTNLDSDNFTGPRGGLHVLNVFRSHTGPIVYHQCSRAGNGSTGRISTLREHFYGVGGYDERFQPYGYEDHDFIRRVVAKYGALVVPQKISRTRRIWNAVRWKGIFANRFNRAVPNERPANDDDLAPDWEEMNAANHLLSIQNLRAGKLVANSGNVGAPKVWKYTDGEFVEQVHVTERTPAVVG
ncbi:MAG: hypothetical protein KDD51_01980 [Bdellovibrionales bacterium]|nr:hypothetical protein [Bdellovibrionales bacterium]